jgi:cysteine desulfurase
VLHTAEFLRDFRDVRLTILSVDVDGQINLGELEKALADSKEKTLVSIMHANNEIGVMADIRQIGAICRNYHALFHSDTVQTFAHYPIDVAQLPVDYLTGSAHKFHGPKGVGFLYMRKSAKIGSFIHGGGQERNLRAGTENVAGIVGMAEAARLAYQQLDQDKQHISVLKQYAVELLQKEIAGVEFNGLVGEQSLYTVLSISLPPHPMGSLLLFQLDMKGICVSGGSACSSGAAKGSHVIEALGKDDNRITIRCSFSRMNKTSDVEAFVTALKELYIA